MPLGTEWRTACRFSHQAGAPDSWCIRNYRVTVTDGTDSAADLANAFADLLVIGNLRLLPTSVTLVEVVVSPSATPTTVAATLNVNEPGDYPTTKFFPLQLAGLIRLSYVGLNPRHPGKWYQPYLPMWSDVADYTAWENDFVAFATSLTNDISNPLNPAVAYSPAVWHRASGTSSLIDALITADNRFWTQRRRVKDLTERTFFVDCAGPL